MLEKIPARHECLLGFLLKNNRSNSKTHRLVDSHVFFTKRALYLLQLESLTHLKINFFSFMKLV